MKQSLQLRLGQQLTMTPQLQQAIRLLQLSSLELQVEVQQALDSNMMLEEDEAEGSPEEAPEASAADTSELETSALEERAELPEELPVDSAWDDIYDAVPTTTAGSGSGGEEHGLDYSNDSASETLRDHLTWQMQLSRLSADEQLIAETIIDAVSEDGFLTTGLEELQAALAAQGLDVTPEQMEAVLTVVQAFDPPGVAARDLREGLLLQLDQLPRELPHWETARLLVADHFELLAHHDYNQLKRRTRLGEAALSAAIGVIQSLTPRPGALISTTPAEYVVPDVVVKRVNHQWRVELNAEAAPKLRINTTYEQMIKQVTQAQDSSRMKHHLQEARWFIKSLRSRNETLLRVATAIVEKQRGFLEHGEVAMKPLVLHDIADELEMHESTISRVTSRKYMHTPRGVYELKYFFSSHVGTTGGGEASSTAIRALLKQMVAEEDPAKPLSDSKLAKVLSDQGINVARRTVAKYRELLAIPPSNERKRLA